MLVTYVDRCAACSCSSLRDEGGRRPVPGLSSCGDDCRCHGPAPRSARAVLAAHRADAARLRLFRRSRSTASSAVTR